MSKKQQTQQKHGLHFNAVKILIGSWVALLSISGFLAYSYSFRKKRFEPSRPLLIYSILVIAAFTLIFTQRIVTDYAHNEFDVYNAGKLYAYLNIFSAVVSYMNSLFMTNRIVRFLNEAQLFESLAYFHVDREIIKSSLLVIVVKVVAFPLALEATLIIRQMRDEPTQPIYMTLYTLMPWILASITPNCFFAALVVNRELLTVLNKTLKNVSKEVNCMQSQLQMELQKPYYRMQRFCDLADKLDDMAIQYKVICEQCLVYMDLLAAPFLCSLVCNLFGITAGLFAHYHAIADLLINEETFDTFKALTNSVFLVISILEIAMQAHFSNESLMVAKQTGHLLQRMNLLHADIRFKQSVEAFSLLILVKKYKIEPWGLLEINVSLVHDVLSAVTSFLLILIQSDLALRFSLK